MKLDVVFSKPMSRRFVEDEVGDRICKANLVHHQMFLADLLLLLLMSSLVMSTNRREVHVDPDVVGDVVVKMAMPNSS